MKALAEFTRTTLVGGILVLLPIYLAVLLLLKALSAVMALMAPVTARVPATAELRQVIAILITLAVCFIAGIVVRTGPGGRGIQKLQRHVLEKIPGYQLLRNILACLTGDETASAFPTGHGGTGGRVGSRTDCREATRRALRGARALGTVAHLGRLVYPAAEPGAYRSTADTGNEGLFKVGRRCR
jgi:hypothetical protein